jgi:hypothetical protein
MSEPTIRPANLYGSSAGRFPNATPAVRSPLGVRYPSSELIEACSRTSPRLLTWSEALNRPSWPCQPCRPPGA